MNEKRLSRILIIALITILVISSLIAEGNLLKGKDFVKLGSLQTVSGKLVEKKGEWYIISDDDMIALHFGPREFLESKDVTLEKTKDFTVSGFLLEEDLAVVSFQFKGKLIELRTETGDPLWKNTKFSKNSKNEEPQKILKKSYVVDSAKCISCQLCVSTCPVDAIKMVEGKAEIDPDKCINCGICANGDSKNYRGCPVDAISKDK
jgi:ferredoxin